VAAVVLMGAGWLYGVGMAARLVPMLLDTVGWSDFKEPEMIPVRGGEFGMGSAEDDPEADKDEQPRHRVTIKAFELGRYEVTFEEYDLFARARGLLLPPDQGWGRGRRPVIYVSWDEAVAYAAWLSRKTGKLYRLPTEAEWEYAARAGTETTRFWGNDPRQACRYANGADERWRAAGGTGAIHECDDGQVLTAEVGSYEANPLGLHDMLGNVWEWTCSAYEENYQGQENVCISHNDAGVPRALRGGSWSSAPRNLRAAYRYRLAPDYRFYDVGFRLARTFPF
jgi:formylglycine-generating enzyme required for sulfatase activity